jgi:hypothetical protein
MVMSGHTVHHMRQSKLSSELWGWAQLPDGGHWVWHAVRDVRQVAVTPLFRFQLACGRQLNGIGVARQTWPYPGEATCERCGALQRA